MKTFVAVLLVSGLMPVVSFELRAADQPAATAPVAGQPWTLPLPGKCSLDMVWIPPGSFLMGRPAADADDHKYESPDEWLSRVYIDHQVAECPQHKVTLTQGFWLGKYKVTQAQWFAVTGKTAVQQRDSVIGVASRDLKPYFPVPAEGSDYPIFYVGWDKAISFCAAVIERERAAGHLPLGYEYTLPTEAQWEYACRAGGTTLPALSASAAKNDSPKTASNDGTWVVVNQGRPNAWGLYDMLGYGQEPCYDWYGPYPGGSVVDPTGPALPLPGGWLRAVRGLGLTSASRMYYGGGVTGGMVFRLALSPILPPNDYAAVQKIQRMKPPLEAAP